MIVSARPGFKHGDQQHLPPARILKGLHFQDGQIQSAQRGIQPDPGILLVAARLFRKSHS